MKEIEMPSLSPTMEEGKIIRWVKKEGEEVKRGDIIAEIETDKAAMEYESEWEGRIGKIIKKEGEEVKVGEVIGLMLEKGEGVEEIEKYKGKEERKENNNKESNNKESNNKVIKQVEEPVVKGKQETSNTNYLSNKENRIFISPLARTIATQNNVDISKVHGTGPNNRIVKADILSYLKMGNNESENTSQHSFNNNLDEAPYRDIKNTAMRKTIAKRLLESKTSIPHYYLTMDCIVDDLLKLRVTINNNAKGKYKISINDIIIKALALAMRDMPEANSYWKDNFTREFLRQDVAVAVAIPNGLVTPIIKDAANKGLIEISNEMKDLANRAKLGTLKFNEIQGGGFSLSNLGMYGIENFAAIINPPQAGILAISAVHKKPVIIDDEVVIANVLKITLSADHRILDGASGAIFLNKIKNYLETPASMLL